MIVVPLKNHPGVDMRRLKVSGQISAGTTYIELDDVEVPVKNLIGEEGMGMKYIMTNFNHERLTIAIGTTRQARVALSSAFAYCLKREAFGKTLMEQPVVRHRLAKAGALLESQWAWVEQFGTSQHLVSASSASKPATVAAGGNYCLTSLPETRADSVLYQSTKCAI